MLHAQAGTSPNVVRRTGMRTSPSDRRNRLGCLIIAGVLAEFVAIYLLVGLVAKPANTVATKIQVAPESQQRF